MSQILIDRGLLQRLLDEYFERDALARAYLTIQQRAALRASNQSAIFRFVDAHQAEASRQRDENQGIHRRLTETLAAGDDAAFLSALDAQFPHR